MTMGKKLCRERETLGCWRREKNTGQGRETKQRNKIKMKKSAGQGRDPVLDKGKNPVFDTVENPLLKWGENPPLSRFLSLGSMQISQQRPLRHCDVI